jgi:hypothetical protein
MWSAFSRGSNPDQSSPADDPKSGLDLVLAGSLKVNLPISVRRSILDGPWQGSVALTWNGRNEPSRTGCSDSKTEELVDETDFACGSGLRQHAMASADHPHHLEAFDRGVSSFHPLKAARWSDHTLERTMIRLNDVVQIFRRPVLDAMRQVTLSSQAPDGLRVIPGP